MSRFILSCLSTACLATAMHAQTAPASTETPPAGSIEHLDKFVVSAGPDSRTTFDLAQGTSVLTGEELRRAAQGTLGETLSATPGVSSTYYGPGASRPIIRGLGGDRVRVLDNGVGALDASNVSPDHNPTLEPLFASRIEVLRGPSALLYGSSAVGGAVNVINNVIPDTPPLQPLAGTLELRGGGAENERAGILSAESGNATLGVHLNLLDRRTGDLAIPGVARIDADAPADQARGTLPNSATDTRNFGLGASTFGNLGHAGAAISQYETEYGVPTGETPPITIHMKQERLDLGGEATQPFGPFRGAKVRIGFGDYTHSEMSGGRVNTRFHNRGQEGRLELPHVAVGRLTGMIGVQVAKSDFGASGEEVATPPSLTTNAAVLALEELELSDSARLEFGGRIEGTRIRLGEVNPGLPPIAGLAAASGQRKRFAAASGSVGLVTHPAQNWTLATSVAYTERAPTAEELFSNGPHGGTAAYEIGTSSLPIERSVGLDVSLRRRTGLVTLAVSGFVNRFHHYVFQQQLPLAAVPTWANEEQLTPLQFVGRDAFFRGGEAEVSLHLLDTETRHLHLGITSDYVRADLTDASEALPRIAPWRSGMKLAYDDTHWSGTVEWRHVASQEHVAPLETLTPGYDLLNADVTFNLPFRRVGCELFARGSNLTNAAAREHTSFLKAFAPLPGRGILAGARWRF